MQGGGLHVRITQTAENTWTRISWWETVETVVRELMINGRGWSSVQEVCGYSEGLSPIGWWHGWMDE
jgi:hypothetical protein